MTSTTRSQGLTKWLPGAGRRFDAGEKASLENESLQALYAGESRQAKRALKRIPAGARTAATWVKLASVYALQGRHDVAQRTLKNIRPGAPASARELDAFLALAVQTDFAVTKLLLDHGASAEGRGSAESRPLARALGHQHWDIAQMLLNRGARPGAGAPDEALLGKLEDALQTDLARMLLAQASPTRHQSLLAPLLAGGRLSMVAILLDLGASLEEIQRDDSAWHRVAEMLSIPAKSTAKAVAETIKAELLAPQATSTHTQLRVLADVRQRGAKEHAAATAGLLDRAKKLGYEDAQVKRLRAYVTREAPLTINFPSAQAKALAADLLYKNQFGTHTSKGTLDYAVGGKRDGWERRFFGGDDVYGKGRIDARDRPRYGFVNAQKARKGASNYGDAMLVLQPSMRARVTLTQSDSSWTTARLGTLTHGADHVLLAYNESRFKEAMAASQGDRQQRPTGMVDGHYLEMQVHATLRLDGAAVKKVVALRSSDYGERTDHLRMLAARAQARFTWHGITCTGSGRRVASLATLHKEGWEVQVWTYAQKYDYLGYAKFNATASAVHQFLDAPTAQRSATLAMLSDTGLQVVGFSVNAIAGTDHFLAKAAKDETPARMEYRVNAGRSPLSLAQAHQKDGYTLCGIAPGSKKDRWQVVLGRPALGAAPVKHERLVSKSAGTLPERFDNAYSHGKQRGTVAALMPLDEAMDAIEVYTYTTRSPDQGSSP